MSALVLEDGTGLTNSNSYCSVGEATVYHSDRLHNSEWETSDDQVPALIWATRMLDEQVNWQGSLANEDQALRWPRAYVYTRDGVLIDEDVIPQWLKDATAELAYHLLSSDRLAEAGTMGFKEISLPGISIKPDKFDRPSVLPKSVWSIIAPYGSRVGVQKRLVLG